MYIYMVMVLDADVYFPACQADALSDVTLHFLNKLFIFMCPSLDLSLFISFVLSSF